MIYEIIITRRQKYKFVNSLSTKLAYNYENLSLRLKIKLC